MALDFSFFQRGCLGIRGNFLFVFWAFCGVDVE